MKKTDLKPTTLPDLPGVYFFLGARREILYIGKATSLRNRLLSYFSSDLADKRSPLIEKMVAEAKTIDFTPTDSVLEALILEANLIRTHKPAYNTRSKDDKSFNYLIITKEEYPRVLLVRGKDLAERFKSSDIRYQFGPFPDGRLFKEAMKIVRRLFQFYDTKTPVDKATNHLARGQIDFNRQIGLYPKEVDKAAYARTIKHLAWFFSGRKDRVIKDLEKEMLRHAKKEEFEAAAALKRRLFALNHIQDIALLKADLRTYRGEGETRLEAYDVAHIYGRAMVGVMTVVEGGQVRPGEYRKFKINSVTGANDTAALREILTRRFAHDEWPRPQIIVVDGGTAQKRVAERVVKERELAIPVVAVVKDDRHRPVRLLASRSLHERYGNEILLANAEAHRFAVGFHRQRRDKEFRPLKDKR